MAQASSAFEELLIAPRNMLKKAMIVEALQAAAGLYKELEVFNSELMTLHNQHVRKRLRLGGNGKGKGDKNKGMIADKGEGKGALILTETRILDAKTGECIATTESTSFARANGGFGGPSISPKVPRTLPARAPDLSDDWTVIPQLALIYRLSGDYNPLHADPAFAAKAGFSQPILHGRATFGIAGIALLRQLCGWHPARLTAMEARFSAPVYPGDTIRTEIWREGSEVFFRCTVPARNAVVLNNGWAEVSG